MQKRIESSGNSFNFRLSAIYHNLVVASLMKSITSLIFILGWFASPAQFVQLYYPGTNQVILDAVKEANKVLSDPRFYTRIENIGIFDNTTYTGMQISNEMRAIDTVEIGEYYKRRTRTNAKTASKIRLNTAKLERSLISIAKTLVHETVHAADWKTNNQWNYTHRTQYEEIPPKSAPYIIGAIAEQMMSPPGNPIFPGWYADPEGTIFGKKFWIYPTYSAKYEQQIFLDAFSSTDMQTWTKHEKIIDTSRVKWAKKAMWAPAIIKKGNKYYLFFSANDVHPNEIGGIGVAVADKPEGPFKDLLGKPLIGEIHNGAQPIDQFLFKDKGEYYMIYGGWGHCNMVKLKSDFTGLLPFEDGTTYKEITPKGYVEGPIMFTRKNKYYFMWSEGGWTGPNYSVAYAIADKASGPFERIGTILQQDTAVATGAGHHSVIQIPGKDEWYIVYHRRPLGKKGANERVVCIDRMYFDEKGLIKPVRITHEGVGKVKMK